MQHTTRRHLLTLLGAAVPASLPVSLLGGGGARAADLLPAVAEKDAVIAFGHIGPISDGGWTFTHHRGLLAVKAAYPAAKYLEVETIPVSADASRTFRQFVENGANIVFATSEYGDLLGSVAEDATEVAFLECDGHAATANLSSYYVQHWMVSYVLGIAAGQLSRSGRLGFVGSLPVPAVYGCANAFLLGARSTAPKATIQVILINSWFDPQAASQAASALVQNGVDLIYTNLDDASVLTVAEKAGIRAVTWNTDMRALGPNAYISSVLLDWNGFYLGEVGRRLAGRWSGGARTLLPMGRGVDRDAWGAKVPASVAASADAMRSRIISQGYNPFVGELRDAAGRVRVRAGETMSRSALEGWDWPIEGVSGLKLS